MLLAVKGVQAESPKDPIYLKTSKGWNAAYAHGNEYAEFRVIGNSAKLQDPYHILFPIPLCSLPRTLQRLTGRFPVDVKVRRRRQLEDHQDASDVEKRARERTVRRFCLRRNGRVHDQLWF